VINLRYRAVAQAGCYGAADLHLVLLDQATNESPTRFRAPALRRRAFGPVAALLEGNRALGHCHDQDVTPIDFDELYGADSRA
jgi:hypothetical protein